MYRAVDYWFELDCDDPVLAGLLDETFKHCRVDGVDAGVEVDVMTVAVEGDDVTIDAGGDQTSCLRRGAVQTVVSMVNLRGFRDRSADLPVLHGGAVVEVGRTDAVVVLGKSGSGKSTLVSSLLADSGGRYLADESPRGSARSYAGARRGTCSHR